MKRSFGKRCDICYDGFERSFVRMIERAWSHRYQEPGPGLSKQHSRILKVNATCPIGKLRGTVPQEESHNAQMRGILIGSEKNLKLSSEHRPGGGSWLPIFRAFPLTILICQKWSTSALGAVPTYEQTLNSAVTSRDLRCSSE